MFCNFKIFSPIIIIIFLLSLSLILMRIKYVQAIQSYTLKKFHKYIMHITKSATHFMLLSCTGDNSRFSPIDFKWIFFCINIWERFSVYFKNSFSFCSILLFGYYILLMPFSWLSIIFVRCIFCKTSLHNIVYFCSHIRARFLWNSMENKWNKLDDLYNPRKRFNKIRQSSIYKQKK